MVCVSGRMSAGGAQRAGWQALPALWRLPGRSSAGQEPSAAAVQALAMGLVNAVVPLAALEQEALAWCREVLRNSPTALRVLKAALNAAEDGQAGLQARARLPRP